MGVLRLLLVLGAGLSSGWAQTGADDMLAAMMGWTPPVAATATFSPTNHDGTVAKDYWTADSLSASPVTSWRDLLGASPLTNAITSPTLVTASGAINGHNYVAFDGISNALRSTYFTINQPDEIDMVCCMVNFAGTAAYFWDSTGSASRQDAYMTGALDKGMAGTIITLTTSFPTNKWVVRSWVFTNSMLTFYTNGVAEAAAAPCGGNNLIGLTVANQYALNVAVAAHLYIAEIVASPSLTVAGRSNLVSYWTNLYKIAP